MKGYEIADRAATDFRAQYPGKEHICSGYAVPTGWWRSSLGCLQAGKKEACCWDTHELAGTQGDPSGKLPDSGVLPGVQD